MWVVEVIISPPRERSVCLKSFSIDISQRLEITIDDITAKAQGEPLV